jgi:hypothetical protein
MSTPATAAYTNASSTAPAGYGRSVIPSDTDQIPATRALYIGVGGNLVVTDIVGQVTYSNVPTGSILPVQAIRVLAAGTTASSIVALY